MFLGEPLGFFITVSSDVFIFLHAFISSDGFIFLCAFNYSCFCFFRCFYCWLHLFNSLFLHCLSGTLFLCCYHECYRFERQFLLPGIFYLTLLPAFIKDSLGPAVLPWRLWGFPLKFETQTQPMWLFESHCLENFI